MRIIVDGQAQQLKSCVFIVCVRRNIHAVSIPDRYGVTRRRTVRFVKNRLLRGECLIFWAGRTIRQAKIPDGIPSDVIPRPCTTPEPGSRCRTCGIWSSRFLSGLVPTDWKSCRSVVSMSHLLNGFSAGLSFLMGPDVGRVCIRHSVFVASTP